LRANLCKMVILAIDTSTKVCSAAVIATSGQTGANTSEVIASRIDRESGNHAKLLPVFIDELLTIIRQKGLKLDAVTLSEGPGSYTGLRIGTSTAKGLCYGLDVPLIPIPTTEVLCAAVKKSHSSLASNLLPLIDARRMEVYTALYDAQIQPLTEIRAVVVESRDSLTSNSEAVYFFGDGAEKCREILESETWQFVPDIVPNAACMGELAEAKWKAEKALKTPNEVAYYEPFYLKEFMAAKSHIKGLE